MRFFCLSILLAAGQSVAAPVTWSLNDVSFDDGASLTGTFIYDADTNVFSDISILSQGGQGNSGSTAGWDNNVVFASDELGFELLSANSDEINIEQFFTCGFGGCLRALSLTFKSSLTNAGGLVSLGSGSIEQLKPFGFEDYVDFRNIVSGSVSATVVPIPAAVWLFGSALAGLGIARRRKLAP